MTETVNPEREKKKKIDEVAIEIDKFLETSGLSFQEQGTALTAALYRLQIRELRM